MEPEDQLNPEEQLKAENALLKLKLELEHDMKQADTSSLSTEVESGRHVRPDNVCCWMPAYGIIFFKIS